jgi:hypothetical protein
MVHIGGAFYPVVGAFDEQRRYAAVRRCGFGVFGHLLCAVDRYRVLLEMDDVGKSAHGISEGASIYPYLVGFIVQLIPYLL